MRLQQYLFIALQYILPKHIVTTLVGWLANTRISWIKNTFIRCFIKYYHVDMNEAVIKDTQQFACFNDFFTREIDLSKRPIADDAFAIASPADGTIAQVGHIQHGQLLQAKNHFYSLENLLGGDTPLAQQFANGGFATIYLAPHNYHRVHMPMDGKLTKTIFVPGNLFSVNNTTAEFIPNLYSRNERLICLFQSSVGQFAVILVGAMIVGSIKTVWDEQPVRASTITLKTYDQGPYLPKGAELGRFQLGSTVILLYPKHGAIWLHSARANSQINVGQMLGKYCV